jgi:RNA-dependent RNA polymerase
VEKGITYNEEMVPLLKSNYVFYQLIALQELHAESLSFGVLTNPYTMMVMKTRQSIPESKVKLILNLKRKEIEVRFPSLARYPLYDQYPWFRPEYRLCISLDQDFSIAQIHEPNDKVSFVLHLDTPPPYAKKQHEEVLGSHDAEARRWLENDVWLRQTVIVGPYHENNDTMTPISLSKSEGAINIGRWTTFCITFDEAERDVDKFRIMRNALRDFNIKVTNANDFKYVAPVRPVWDFLDEHLLPSTAITASHARERSLLEEFASLSLPFSVRYLLDVCISTGRLNEYVVREGFLRALIAAGEFKACNKLKLILDLPANRELVDPMSIFNDRKFRPILRRAPKIPENCALIYSATVTATTIIFHVPSVEITNRVIRQYKQYADRFLRVRFEDDKYRGNSRIYATTTNKMDAVFRRVRRTLTSGIQMGDRKYEFLAWGNSQLREHGAYFFADLPNALTASQIRAFMGQFGHENIIAKRAARMGQCFSTTKPVKLRIPRVTRTSLIPDVERNGYTFTDGVGQISPLLADLINHQLKLDDQTPSLFQFRLGGCKGVLAVSEDLKGIDIRLRNSQFKFASESNDLEVIRCSRFEGAHLNRQLILVLSALGVDDSVFLGMQEKEIKELDEAMDNDEIADGKLRATVDANQATLKLADMVDRGFRAGNEPFVTSLLRLWRAWSLKYLKEKAKLHVENGATLLGCVDETATLRGHYNYNQPGPDASYEKRYDTLPEIFFQVETTKSKERRAKQKRDGETPDLPVYHVKEGLCLIARNPSLHEGDIRVVRAINVQALSHQRDVLVFPQKGDRDLPNMCSGGDLDGDDYLVIWAADLQTPKFDLFPTIWNADPMDYTAPPPMRAAGDITQNDIIQFFDQYMRNDFLGRIAHAHLGWADNHDEGIRSDQCLQLANLHSQAVDYPKTGRPAKLPKALDRFEWPHFMEKKGGKEYRSHKILGKLYDKVERVKFVPNYRGKFDDRVLNAVTPSAAVLDQTDELKRNYDASLRRIMAQHEIRTEFEIWSTFVLNHSKASRDFKFHEEIGNLSKSLKEEFEEAIMEVAGGKTFEHLRPYAVAAYQLVSKDVTEALGEVEKGDREEIPEQMPFMSFPWVLHETLGTIAAAATHPAKNEAPFQDLNTYDEGDRDAKNISGQRQRIQSNLQGELFEDPYQPEAGSIGNTSKDETTEPTDEQPPKPPLGPDVLEPPPRVASLSPTAEQIQLSTNSTSSTAGPISDIRSRTPVRGKVTNLLDDDENDGFGVHSEIVNETTLIPPPVTKQQWEEIDQINGSPLIQRGRNSDRLVSVSKGSSAPLSRVVSANLWDDEIKLDRQQHDPKDTPVFHPTDSASISSELEVLNLDQQSYVDEDGMYRSKFQRSSIHSEPPSSRRSIYQVSGEGGPAGVRSLPITGRHSSNTPAMPPLPERPLKLMEGQGSQVQRTTPKLGTTTMSAKAVFRKEIDSDGEGEIKVYDDPARMAF